MKPGEQESTNDLFSQDDPDPVQEDGADQSAVSNSAKVASTKGVSQKAPDYHINTAPEMDALERAAADGKYGRHYSSEEQLGIIQHAIPGASHLVRLSLTNTESMAGLTAEALEQLVHEQDADAALAFLYIARVLAPPLVVPDMGFGRGIIDFDDVLSKIGWDPRSTSERRDMHRKIYQFIMFGERAQVIGRRRGAYKDKHTGELIDTEISAPLWRIHETERPEQASLFPAHEIPVRVELVMSRTWIDLLTSGQTAQFLPMGEMLGAIPGNKPSGAWARVIGLALASFWRRNPRGALSGQLRPTRRELLERYPPKTGTVADVLSSKNPRRAVEYWCDALQILVSAGLLDPAGETLISFKEMRASLPTRDWSDQWLDQKVEIYPGLLIKPHIEGRSAALPLTLPTPKRGRPKKQKQ
ncbi:hypothetical protein EON80_04120 [bacterium]|nr:MAG: hypothetical protein EON80_04120 [bacterium]